MRNNNNMVRMNISLSNKQIALLKKVSEIEHRPYSKQIVHMIEYYVENNHELKKKMEQKNK